MAREQKEILTQAFQKDLKEVD